MALISRHTSLSSSAVRPKQPMRLPSLASLLAAPYPMPDPAPVISETFPCKSISLWLESSAGGLVPERYVRTCSSALLNCSKYRSW